MSTCILIVVIRRVKNVILGRMLLYPRPVLGGPWSFPNLFQHRHRDPTELYGKGSPSHIPNPKDIIPYHDNAAACQPARRGYKKS
jgi:hypothetical protein